MNALDTNVVIRFLVADDILQTQKVYELFKKAESQKQELYITILVILETIWVLESVYEINKKDILNSISDMMRMPILKFEHHSSIQAFIDKATGNNYDLSDVLIAQCAKSLGCNHTYTFDKKATRFSLFTLLGKI